MIYVNKIVLCEPNEPFYSRIQFGSCLFLSDNGHFINVSIKIWNDFFLYYVSYLNVLLELGSAAI